MALEDLRGGFRWRQRGGTSRAEARRHDAPREAHRAGANIFFGDLVDESRGLRRIDCTRLAVEHQRQRGVEADEPRHALRTAGSRKQSEVDLGQADLRPARCDAVVAAGGQFTTTAQRVAVQRHDNRFSRVLETLNDVGQMRRLGRQIELADVGAGAECAARARDHDRAHRGIEDRLIQRFDEAGTHVSRQRVDRRVVDDNHGDAFVARQRHDLGFGGQVGEPVTLSRSARTRNRAVVC